MVSQLCKYIKNHWIVHSEKIKSMVCKLYLNNAVLKKKLIYTISTYKKGETESLKPCYTSKIYTSPEGLRGDRAIGEKK